MPLQPQDSRYPRHRLLEKGIKERGQGGGLGEDNDDAKEEQENDDGQEPPFLLVLDEENELFEQAQG